MMLEFDDFMFDDVRKSGPSLDEHIKIVEEKSRQTLDDDAGKMNQEVRNFVF